MQNFLAFFFLFYCCSNSFSQTINTDTTIYTIVEQSPEFPGGEKALYKYLKDNLRYPIEELQGEIKGKVIVSFIIWTDGSIRNVELKNNVSPGLDKEAIRLISEMPKWNAGMHDGKAVPCRYIVPVVFRLQ